MISGLAKRLIDQGLLTAKDAEAAEQLAQSEGISIVAAAVKSGSAKAKDIALQASTDFGLPLLDLQAIDVELVPLEAVSSSLIQKHRVLPLFQRGNRLFIAQSDPSLVQALDEIKFNTGMSVEPVLVEEDKLSIAVDKFLSANDSGFGDLSDDLDDIDLDNSEQKEQAQDDSETEDAPIVKFINKMLLDAVKLGASDLHFEPYEKRYRVRYRTDGVLHEVASPPVNLAGKIAARLKVMSQMDISERRIPQDGRIKMKISKKPRHRFPGQYATYPIW